MPARIIALPQQGLHGILPNDGVILTGVLDQVIRQRKARLPESMVDDDAPNGHEFDAKPMQNSDERRLHHSCKMRNAVFQTNVAHS